jgi:hypothetical protein
MEKPEKLSLYEHLYQIEGIEIPDVFQSQLDEYILGMTNGVEVAQTIAFMLKNCGTDALGKFMNVIEDHILDVMSNEFAILDSATVTEKKMRLFRYVVHFVYSC